MKKGFTMIELIFVIVILGILASVAIPRLAATRTDAEVATTVGNIRTLLSDAASYYAVKGSFAGAKWRDVTNVPVRDGGRNIVNGNRPITSEVYLAAGGINCLIVRIRDKNNDTPAACIEIAKVRANKTSGICPDIINAEPIKAFLDLRVPNVTPIEKDGAGVIVFEPSISIHQ